jgi:hypothetical protein
MVQLAQHQKIFIKVHVPLEVDTDGNGHEPIDREKKDSSQKRENVSVSLYDLCQHPTFASQRKHLNDKLCDVAYQQYKRQHPEFQDGCKHATNCGYTLVKPVRISLNENAQTSFSSSSSSPSTLSEKTAMRMDYDQIALECNNNTVNAQKNISEHTNEEGYLQSSTFSSSSNTKAKANAYIVCQKTHHDSSNHMACCMGKDTATNCDKGYGPTDPDGYCLPFTKYWCCGKGCTCSRQKFLTNAPRTGSSWPDFFCSYWYLSNVNAYTPHSNHLHPPPKAKTKKMNTAYQIIMDYCGKYPESGECSCIKAFDLCACQTNQYNCGVYGDPHSHYGRRYAMYKKIDTSKKGNPPQYKFQKVMPNKNLPVHCWSQACQFSNACAFLPQKDLEKNCPSICMVFSQNSTTSYKKITGYKELAVDSYTLSCRGSNAPQGASKVRHALQFDTAEITDDPVPDTWVAEKRFTLVLTNYACDKDNSKNGKRYFCISTSAGKIAFPGKRRGCLKTGQSCNVPVYVNTSGLSPGQHWVQLLVEDVCDGSAPYSALYTLNVNPNSPIKPHKCARK